MGSTATSGTLNAALKPTTSNSSENAPPMGNNTIAMKRNFRRANTPSTPINNQPTTTTSTQSRWTQVAGGVSIWLYVKVLAGLVVDVYAPILGPRLLVMPELDRLFLAEADRLHLLVCHAQQFHGLTHGIGALLSQSQVVLATTALIGVAFEAHAGAGVGNQVLAVLFDQRTAGRCNFVFIVFKEDAAFGQGRLRVVQRMQIHRFNNRHRHRRWWCGRWRWWRYGGHGGIDHGWWRVQFGGATGGKGSR